MKSRHVQREEERGGDEPPQRTLRRAAWTARQALKLGRARDVVKMRRSAPRRGARRAGGGETGGGSNVTQKSNWVI